MHNIVDYAIQYLDYAILHSMVIFTHLTGYMALQRGAYYISPCAKGCTWMRQLELEFCLECQHYPYVQAVLVLPATGSS